MTDQASKSDAYILNRDWHGMARLHYRHLLFNLVHGYILHPSIEVPENACIADVGAGTCLWPVELSQKLPSTVSIDAIDISLAQCPPTGWLPKNVNLIQHDIYEPLPESLSGKYDIVHIQNWICIWRDNTSETLITNIVKMLKPGGYIQWNEQDPDVNRVVHAPNSSTPGHGTQEILNFLAAPRGDINFKWVSRLDKVLSPYLDVMVFDRHVVPEQYLMFWCVNVLQTCEEFGINVRRNAKTEEEIETAERLQKSTSDAATELLHGVGIHQELVIAIARKPQS